MNETIADAARSKHGVKLALAALSMLLALAAVIGVRNYNEIVAKQERATGAWSKVVSNYQRRRELVPMLVETVSGYLKHEQETLLSVTRKRRLQTANLKRLLDDLATANATTRTVGADSASLMHVTAAERRLGNALHGLIAVVEDNPELRSAERFSMLQSQLEGTENRIHIARLRFNEATEAYNRAIRRIPGNLVAAVAGLESKPYFEADPDVDRPTGIDVR